MKPILAIALFVTIASASSCSKTSVASLNPALFGKWKTTGHQEKQLGSYWVNVYAALADCEKDDIFHFMPDGIFRFEEGTTSCDPSDPEIILEGIWGTPYGNTLTIKEDGQVSQFKIAWLDNTSLELRIGSGNGAEATYSFVKVP